MSILSIDNDLSLTRQRQHVAAPIEQQFIGMVVGGLLQGKIILLYPLYRLFS